VGTALTGDAAFPIFIVLLVVAMILWAMAFTRLAPGFRIILDSRSGITVPWVQTGWVMFAWAFLFVSIWPLIDVLMVEAWDFTDLLLVVLGGLLFFLAAAAIAPNATYAGADGDSRYLEVAPVFFGLFAAYQVWLVVMDNVVFGGADAARISLSATAIVAALVLAFARNMSLQKILSPVAWILATAAVVLQANDVIGGTLGRPVDVAPLQGWIVALFIGSVALAVLFAVAVTMVQLINRHSGFRPYVTHTAWGIWFFFWMLLIWWRMPLLVTDGWEYYEFLFATIGPLLVFLTWTFLAPQGTDGSAEKARIQYFDKAPQAFGLMVLVAAWAVVFDAWLVAGTEGVTGAIGWGVALVLFLALRYSSGAQLHGGVVIFAWLLLIGEFALELSRGVPGG
jgi:hypothetical protein